MIENFLKWWVGPGGLAKDGLKHMQRGQIGGENTTMRGEKIMTVVLSSSREAKVHINL